MKKLVIVVLLISGISLTGCTSVNDVVKDVRYGRSDGEYKPYHIYDCREDYNDEKYDPDDEYYDVFTEAKVTNYITDTYVNGISLSDSSFNTDDENSKKISSKRYKRYDIKESGPMGDKIVGRISYDAKENKIADTIMYSDYRYIPRKEIESAYKEGEKLAKSDFKQYTMQDLENNTVEKISKIVMEKINESKKENKLYPYEFYVKGYCDYLDDQNENNRLKNIFTINVGDPKTETNFDFDKQMVKTIAKIYKDSDIYDPYIGAKFLIADKGKKDKFNFDFDNILFYTNYEGADENGNDIYNVNSNKDNNDVSSVLINTNNKEVLNKK